ncbi:MAG TPA: hypothetical protein VK689_05340, partial [Armatimonadota bacterium]|nr:hypothetical protein [Armatimonadota bacterium]
MPHVARDEGVHVWTGRRHAALLRVQDQQVQRLADLGDDGKSLLRGLRRALVGQLELQECWLELVGLFHPFFFIVLALLIKRRLEGEVELHAGYR